MLFLQLFNKKRKLTPREDDSSIGNECLLKRVDFCLHGKLQLDSSCILIVIKFFKNVFISNCQEYFKWSAFLQTFAPVVSP